MTAETTEKTIAVPEAALGIVLSECNNDIAPDADPRYRAALAELADAWQAHQQEVFQAMLTPDPPLPDGIFGRVEMPGYREDTGWITEESRFGQQMAVVRDWDGREVALAALGPGCRVVVLPTPRKRPDPPKALSPAGPRPDWEVDEDDLDDDDDGGF